MKKKNLLLDAAIVILVGVIAFSGYNVYKDLKDAQESKKQLQHLEEVMLPEAEEEIQHLSASERYGNVYELNNHFVGWLSIDSTELNYPVMQTKDSPEYYLRRNFDQSYNYHGTPFIDYKCTVDESDNIIIYGHNMDDGSMFSTVEDYLDKAFWEDHKYIYFDTLSDYGVYEVVCVFRIDLRTTDFDFTNGINFHTPQALREYITAASSLSPYSTGVNVEPGDKLLTLSTCEYTLEDGRCVLIAKKIDSPATKAFNSEGNLIEEE